MNITETDSDHFTWTNRAGVSWNLTRIGNSGNFTVGQECPYHDNGYTVAEAVLDDAGTVEYVKGPGGERYDHETYHPSLPSILGNY